MKLIQNSFTTVQFVSASFQCVYALLMCSIPLWSRASFRWWEAWGPGIRSI